MNTYIVTRKIEVAITVEAETRKDAIEEGEALLEAHYGNDGGDFQETFIGITQATLDD